MPPASALERCADIPAFLDDSADAHALWEALMIDLYTDCAQKHDVLRKWHRK
jgi:hypothetical protein